MGALQLFEDEPEPTVAIACGEMQFLFSVFLKDEDYRFRLRAKGGRSASDGPFWARCSVTLAGAQPDGKLTKDISCSKYLAGEARSKLLLPQSKLHDHNSPYMVDGELVMHVEVVAGRDALPRGSPEHLASMTGRLGKFLPRGKYR